MLECIELAAFFSSATLREVELLKLVCRQEGYREEPTNLYAIYYKRGFRTTQDTELRRGTRARQNRRLRVLALKTDSEALEPFQISG